MNAIASQDTQEKLVKLQKSYMASTSTAHLPAMRDSADRHANRKPASVIAPTTVSAKMECVTASQDSPETNVNSLCVLIYATTMEFVSKTVAVPVFQVTKETAATNSSFCTEK